MNSGVFHIKPSESSLGLNIVLYAILLVLNILLSKFYLLELVKRHPLKFENDNQLKAGFVQSLLSLVPALVFSAFSGTKHHSNYLKSSYSSILLGCSLITAIIAWKSRRIISLDLKAIKSFALLTPIAVCSFFIIGSSKALAIPAFFFILLATGFLINRMLNNPVTIGSIETEPNSMDIDVLRALLYPFEVILENLIIVPGLVSKPYSLGQASKILVSPIFAGLLSIMYFNETLNGLGISLIVASSLCAILLLLAASKIQKIGYAMNLYSFLICALLYYLLFDTSLETVASIVNLIDISKAQSAVFLISPQLVIPSFCIYKHFIRAGFYKRTLYSVFYGVVLNLIITHLVGSILLPDADFLHIFWSDGLRVTLMGILVLQLLIFANLVLQKGKFQFRNCSLSLYVLVQDYLITSFVNVEKE